MAPSKETVLPSGAQEASRSRTSRTRSRVLYVLPLLTVLGILGIFPVIYAFYLSLHDYYLTQGVMEFVGLRNYWDGLQDEAFLNAILVNVRIIIASLTLEFLFGLSLAMACHSIKRGRGVIVALLTTPIMVSTSATGMAFRMIMLPEYGPLNYIIAGLTGQERVLIDWLGNVEWALWSLIIANVWRSMPFVMLILLAGLTSISQEIYEAARIDGGSPWQIFTRITLPLLRGPIVVAFVLRLIDLIKLFDLVLLLTQGGPARVTETASFYVYFIGLRFFRVGYGATLSLFLLAIAFILTFVLMRITQRREVQLS